MTSSRITRPALLAVFLIALLMPAGASAGTVSMDVDQSARSVRDYWTKARMRDAEPAPVTVPTLPAPAEEPAAPAESGPPAYVPPAAPGDGDARLLRGEAARSRPSAKLATPVLDPSAPGVRAHGKVFFTVKGGTDPGDFVCSGTAVNSRNRSVVWTAGHCVYDAELGGGKSVNFSFVPAYANGNAPYGEWPAKQLVDREAVEAVRELPLRPWGGGRQATEREDPAGDDRRARDRIRPAPPQALRHLRLPGESCRSPASSSTGARAPTRAPTRRAAGAGDDAVELQHDAADPAAAAGSAPGR